MLKIFVNRIYVLGLQKNETEIHSAYKSILPLEKTQMVLKEGVGNSQNDGKMESSLWKILNHSTIDAVSRDIFKNHISIIREAYENTTNETVLILEEDARFPNWDQKKWDNIENFLRTYPTSWDIFYLGYCNWPYFSSLMVTKNIVKVSSPLTAHAYILNRNGMAKILTTFENQNNLYANMHIDKFFLKIPNFRKYAAFPMVSFQEKCPGLYLKACDKLKCRILFSTFCKVNELISIIVPYLSIFTFTLIILLFVSGRIKKKIQYKQIKL
jgi:hypothetical protein